MGCNGSKIHAAVLRNDINQIRALHTEGASLEILDEEHRTPLILACMSSDLIEAAKVLIELGADVNTCAFGVGGGTALHYAAEQGLDQTVKLLLKSGANPRAVNMRCHTPLEVARSKGHCNVVRALEEHMGLFCGWMRILDGPSIVEAFAPQWVHRKIWVVVWTRFRSPDCYELLYYPNKQAVQPEERVRLWLSDIAHPDYNLPDPAVVIAEKYWEAIGRWYKFLSSEKGDKEQLKLFYKACQGWSK